MPIISINYQVQKRYVGLLKMIITCLTTYTVSIYKNTLREQTHTHTYSHHGQN